MSHRKNHSRNRATSRQNDVRGRHRRERQESCRHAAGNALTGALAPPPPPNFDVRMCRPGHRAQHRRQPVHRPYITAGAAVVGASAIVGSSITPPPADVGTSPVQLVTDESTAPTPNPLLAALVDTRGGSGSDATPSPLTGLAAALGLGLALWDTTVSVGASVVPVSLSRPAAEPDHRDPGAADSRSDSN
jgi:hypothetical protein